VNICVLILETTVGAPFTSMYTILSGSSFRFVHVIRFQCPRFQCC